MFSRHMLQAGVTILLNRLEAVLLPRMTIAEIAQQQQEFFKSHGNEKEFVPDVHQIRQDMLVLMNISIGNRLRAAIELYLVDEQMECVRHIILALGSFFNMIDWKEASVWCGRQSQELWDRKRPNF